jgi:hypothetical protein
MGTVFYSCGCWITTSMFGNREVLGVGFCLEHNCGYSEDVSTKTLATWLRNLMSEKLNETNENPSTQ